MEGAVGVSVGAWGVGEAVGRNGGQQSGLRWKWIVTFYFFFNMYSAVKKYKGMKLYESAV